jgi:hypothetical protein
MGLMPLLSDVFFINISLTIMAGLGFVILLINTCWVSSSFSVQ